MTIKDHKLKIPFLIGLLVLIGSLLSCASITTIKVTNTKGEIDKEVKIYVEGVYKGDGQIQYADAKPKATSMTTTIQLKKPGCQTKRGRIKSCKKCPKIYWRFTSSWHRRGSSWLVVRIPSF